MKNFVMCGLLTMMLGTFWAHPVLAQSRLFSTDQSGFSLGAGFSWADHVSSVGAVIAGIAKARFDFGIAVSRLSFDSSVIGTDGTGVEIRPFVTWGIVRPANSLKLGVELAAPSHRHWRPMVPALWLSTGIRTVPVPLRISLQKRDRRRYLTAWISPMSLKLKE